MELEKNATITKRVIGSYDDGVPGPLLIIFGAIHGNEPAGVIALEHLFDLFALELEYNPDFKLKGKVMGLIGNTRAYSLKQRYIVNDLNRQWKVDNINRIKNIEGEELNAEEKEMKEILTLVDKEISNPLITELIVLDLHTTSSHGGIFIIPTNAKRSLELAKDMHAPVVTGFLNGIFGTTLHYFNNDHFDIETTGITFESGQHEEELSENRAIAAIINLMQSLKMVNEDDVENHHAELLIEHSKKLPKVCRLVLRHPVTPEDNFKMLPDFKNFQIVHKNEQLAFDKSGQIFAPQESRILMPLYQDQGEDGFFLVEEIESL